MKKPRGKLAVLICIFIISLMVLGSLTGAVAELSYNNNIKSDSIQQMYPIENIDANQPQNTIKTKNEDNKNNNK